MSRQFFLCLLLLAAYLSMPIPAAQAARGYFGYGNYCGSSNNGGKPTDRLDEICMEHDRCLLNVGLRASPFALLQKSREAARRSCPCDQILVKNMASYPGTDGIFASLAGWVVRVYSDRRIRLSCGSQ